MVPGSSPPRAHGASARHYVAAVALALLALAAREALQPLLQGQAPFSVLVVAPMLAAWYGGMGPGLLALLLCAVGGQLLFVEPRWQVQLRQADDWVKLVLFLLVAGVATWLIATRRAALATLQGEHEELQATQQALAAREQRVTDTLEASPSGMLLVDAKGLITLVNGEAMRLFGYGRDELVGLPIEALVPASDAAAHLDFRRQYRPEAGPLTKELRARRKDGTEFQMRVGLNPLQGESTGLVLCSVLDVSGQRQTEADLRHSRVQLQQLFETNLLGIMFWTMDRRVLEANDELLRIWGRTREELRASDGLWLDALTPPEYSERDQDWLAQLRTQGAVAPVEKQYLRPDGSRVWVLVGSAMTGDDEGVAFVLDISARKEAELAQREQAAMLESLADNIAQLAWMTDATGYITWYNRRWFEYTGTTPEQMKDGGWQAAHHPEHAPRVLAKFRRHIAAGEPWEDTFPLLGADGQYRWFLSRAFPLHDHAGRVVAWFGTNTDVTAQRQAEEALREADRRKDEFIAVLAHELRNPLAPVRNAVEILKRTAGIEHDPRVVRARDIIDRQVSHMARLIDDLLDVGRIARGKLTLRKEVCDFAAIVCQTADDYRASLEAAGQQLVLHDCDVHAWVDGDPVRLAQMLGNLLNNATRFVDGPGRVEVRTVLEPAPNHANGFTDRAGPDEAPPRYVRVEVTDTGIGMGPELIERLFDPFSQATQDIARSKGGLGLGLALTKGLAELHGGGVMAESEGPGRGSRFTITLPLARTGRPHRAGARTNGNGDALRILVIEDNRDAAGTLGELLQLGGHDVELAYDGASGVEAARRLRPDVVISDLGLPGHLSGYDVGRALRDDPELEGVYLVALSGYADSHARKRSTDAGFDTHLAKPPDIGALERALDAVAARGTNAAI